MSGDHSAKKMNAVVRDAQHYKRVVKSVQIFNANKTFSDLCFICARGHRVYAHKLLFSTVSSLLKEMFLETLDPFQTTLVHLPDVESHMMELLLDFLYEGSVRVNQHEYKDFQSLMDTLGIVLTPPKVNQAGENSTPQMVQPVPLTPQISVPQQQMQAPQQQMQAPQQQMQAPQQHLQSPQQQLQAPQLVYMPTAPNAQGQVQYVLATPSQLNQAQMMHAPLLSPVVGQQTPGQVVQNGTQVLTSPVQQGNIMQMVQQNNTQVQNGAQVQQGNMMQMVQQNNTQVVPMNQLAAGGQMVQCSSQMVLQGNQQSIISNNQLQVGMQTQVAQDNYTTNQSVQQQPQYVMASNTSQLATSRAPTQYHQPRAQSVARIRPAPQHQLQQPTRMSTGRIRRGVRGNAPMIQGRQMNTSTRVVQRSRNMVQ